MKTWLTCSVLLGLLVLACSKKPTPTGADPDAPVGGESAGGADMGVGDSSNAGGNPAQQGSGGAGAEGGVVEDDGPLHQDPPKPVPDFPFDPSKVYLHGLVNNFDEAFALLTEPNIYAVAGDDIGGFIYKQHLVYWTFQLGFHTMVPDYVGSLPGRDLTAPVNPKGNDPILPTPACESTAVAALASPDDRLIYQCPDQAWYEGDTMVYAANQDVQLLHFGNDGLVLVENQYARLGTMNLSDGVVHASTDGESLEKTIYRAHGSGFRFVQPPPLGDERPVLWNIDENGDVQQVGQYPLPPEGVVAPYPSVLTPDDALVELAVDSVNTKCAIQRTTVETTGESKVIYAEKDKPRVSVSDSGGWLYTGP